MAGALVCAWAVNAAAAAPVAASNARKRCPIDLFIQEPSLLIRRCDRASRGRPTAERTVFEAAYSTGPDSPVRRFRSPSVQLFHSARFVVSVAELAGLPAAAWPEIAFAGRSNAGKSTAINV